MMTVKISDSVLHADDYCMTCVTFIASADSCDYRRMHAWTLRLYHGPRI